MSQRLALTPLPRAFFARFLQDGARRTLNGDGVASADDVWANVDEGCSARLSWPQRHSDRVWGMIAMIEV